MPVRDAAADAAPRSRVALERLYARSAAVSRLVSVSSFIHATKASLHCRELGVSQTSYLPNLNREPTRLPISTVVLAGQRIPVTSHLQRQTSDRTASSPLSKRRLLPSVTRVFSASRACTSISRARAISATTASALGRSNRQKRVLAVGDGDLP